MIMLLQKVTAENLQEIIQMNNGEIYTSQLATILGKSNQHLTDKLAKTCPLTNFVSVEEEYNKGQFRTAYLLPEKEAMALAMSYDMDLGMKVYQAFQDYKAALEAIQNADSLEQAKEIATKALNVKIFEAIGSKNKRIGVILGEAQSTLTPVKSFNMIQQEYINQKNVFTNDTEYRKYFLEAWIRSIDSAVELAKEEEDYQQVLALRAEKGKVIAIQKHILEYRLTKAENRIKELETKEQTPEVKAEMVELVQEVEEVKTSNVVELFDYSKPFFSNEELAASVK